MTACRTPWRTPRPRRTPRWVSWRTPRNVLRGVLQGVFWGVECPPGSRVSSVGFPPGRTPSPFYLFIGIFIESHSCPKSLTSISVKMPSYLDTLIPILFQALSNQTGLQHCQHLLSVIIMFKVIQVQEIICAQLKVILNWSHKSYSLWGAIYFCRKFQEIFMKRRNKI
jgi:hypothetical protein